MGCHPARWLWGLIPVAMLGWLAVHGKSDAIERDLEQRSIAALSTAGQDWASVAFSGRDGLLVGHAASESDIDLAASRVRAVWGVRVVDVRATASDTAPPLPRPSPTRTKSRPLEEFVPIPVAAAAAPDAPLTDGGPRSAVSIATASAERVLVALHHEAHAVPEEVTAADPILADDGAPDDVAAHTVRVTPMSTENAPAPVAPEEKVDEGTAAPAADAMAAEETLTPVSHAAVADGAPTPPHRPPPTERAVAVAVAEPLPVPHDGAHGEAPVAAAVLSPETTARALELHHSTQSPNAQTTNDEPEAAAAVEALPLPAPPPPERKPIAPSVSSWSGEAGAQAKLSGAPPSVPPGASPNAPEADPEQPPRFETAALPQGNIGPDAPCTEDVRGAAQQVEVHFARGDARLDRSGKALLDRLVVTLDACPTAALRIAGHADATGIARRNLALSKRRARTVVSYLVDKGIDAGRLAAVGYGETRPVAPNTTRANRARNRRIEVDVTARGWPPAPVRKQGTHNALSHR